MRITSGQFSNMMAPSAHAIFKSIDTINEVKIIDTKKMGFLNFLWTPLRKVLNPNTRFLEVSQKKKKETLVFGNRFFYPDGSSTHVANIQLMKNENLEIIAF